jgi:nucleotide-binding universal stress UspA family protein
MPATVLHIPDPSKIESTMPEDPDKAVAVPSPEDKKSNGKPTNSKRTDKKDDKKTQQEDEKAEAAGEAVQQAAAQIKSQQKDEEKADAPVEVTTIVHEQPSPAVIAEEAEKGYDIFIIGLEKTSTPSAEFDKGVTNLAKGFDGPLIISAVRDDLEGKPDDRLSILVPVNGTEPSRRAAEVAITLARATKAPVTVLYVAVRTATRRGMRRGIRTRRHEEAILKDIVAIADGYNMSIRTAVLAERAADEAILSELERRNHNLVVMGVGRRPGDKLFFGDTAAALLEKSKSSCRELTRSVIAPLVRHGGACLPSVMPGLVLGIHVFGRAQRKTWMAGTSPAMTAGCDYSGGAHTARPERSCPALGRA